VSFIPAQIVKKVGRAMEPCAIARGAMKRPAFLIAEWFASILIRPIIAVKYRLALSRMMNIHRVMIA
jgi:hypothetical protein